MWHSLVPIWTVVLGLGIFIYVALDGFDLGVGMLHGLVAPTQREIVMDSIGPFWDGNETWLILGGVGLLAAFPVAFAIIIPAVYFPILVMLLALVFRGVAFEFRFKDPRLRKLWDWAFCGGSLVATFAQGVVLGSFIQGFKVDGREFTGSSFDFATPFTLMTGVALVAGYGLLGAGWLVMKTEGDLQAWSRRAGRVCLVAVSCCILAVSLWTPLASKEIAQRWFVWPHAALLLPLPVASVAVVVYAWFALGGQGAWQGFAASIALFALSYLGIAASLWPMIVPGHFTLWEAASPESTQAFLLVGTLVLLPVICSTPVGPTGCFAARWCKAKATASRDCNDHIAGQAHKDKVKLTTADCAAIPASTPAWMAMPAREFSTSRSEARLVTVAWHDDPAKKTVIASRRLAAWRSRGRTARPRRFG